MNVYEQIEANSRRTIAILCAFPAALFVMIFLLSYIIFKTGVLLPEEIYFIINYSTTHGTLRHAFMLTLAICPWLFLIVFLWIAFSYYNNGAMILGMAYAYKIPSEENREIHRLVENTAIMAGLPKPDIYIIDDESMNAFATGRDPGTASIALTKGIIDKLDKSELQAVIAHELSHIANRDTRLMMIIIAGIGCFVFLGEVLIRTALRSGSRSRKDNKGTILLLIIGIACFIFGFVVAPILRLALSRRREYQADATAARIIHDPDALARALFKITEDSNAAAVGADFDFSSLTGNKDFFSSPLVGNMCITSTAKVGFLSKMYATHPPIEDRIAALRRMMARGKALY